MKIFVAFITILATVAAVAGPSQAYTVDLYDNGTSGIDPATFNPPEIVYSTASININATWTSSAPSFLIINDEGNMSSWQVTLNFTNATGVDWSSFAFELLDPAGNNNDALYDAAVQPGFIPAGYSSSNDNDGLSFAQGSSYVIRSSDVFAMIDADELNTRDFLDYTDGVSVAGTTGQIMFGLRDYSANIPFLLAMRPNELSVDPAPAPLPSTVLLLGAGLIGLAGAKRGRKK